MYFPSVAVSFTRYSYNVIYVGKCFRVHILEAFGRSFAEDDLSCTCHIVVSKMHSFIWKKFEVVSRSHNLGYVGLPLWGRLPGT